jgi:hypothetical protein
MNNTPLKWRNIAWGRPEEISLQVTHEWPYVPANENGDCKMWKCN